MSDSERASQGERASLGCHSFCFRERDLDGALDGVAEAGYGSLELWHGHAPWSGSPEDALRACRDAGLSISSYCIGGFYGGPQVASAALEAFRFARGLGVSMVTGCLSAASYAAVARAAREAGLRFAVENHWYQALSRPGDLAAVLDLGLELSLDTGHAILARARPEEFARVAGSRLGNIHLKDVAAPGARALLPTKVRRRYLPPPAGSLPLGGGRLDLDALAAGLRDAGYAGPVVVEVEASADPVDDLRASRTRADGLVEALA